MGRDIAPERMLVSEPLSGSISEAFCESIFFELKLKDLMHFFFELKLKALMHF